MELFTSLPARKDGTLKVTAKSGAPYVFNGQPLSCTVEDEDDIEHLRLLGFMDADEFEAEAKFKQMSAEREKRRVAAGITSPASARKVEQDDDDDLSTSGPAHESETAPTGRVRKASKASVVQ